MALFRTPPDDLPPGEPKSAPMPDDLPPGEPKSAPMPDDAPAFGPKRRMRWSARVDRGLIDSLGNPTTPAHIPSPPPPSEPPRAHVSISPAGAEDLAAALVSAADLADAMKVWRSAADKAHEMFSRGLEFSEETASIIGRLGAAADEAHRTRSAFRPDRATLLRNFDLAVVGSVPGAGPPHDISAASARDLAGALRSAAAASEAAARWKADAALARAAIHPSLRGARLAEALFEEAKRVWDDVRPHHFAVLTSFDLRVEGPDPRSKGGDDVQA